MKNELTLYFPSPTWNTLNFCLQVHNITSLLTSSCMTCASGVAFSCQSGLRAAINSFQSMRPRLFLSNISATAFISKREVSNSVYKYYNFNHSLSKVKVSNSKISENKTVGNSLQGSD